MPQATTQHRLSTVSRHLQASSSSSSFSSAMAYRSPVTSHVLDTARGCPAAGMRVELQVLDAAANGDAWRVVNIGKTNADGRVETPLVPEGARFEAGTYRVVFFTREYFEAAGVREFFYPRVEVVFLVKDPTQHFHVPLLINPFGYSTYRGS